MLAFYDRLAPDYHLIFADWSRSIGWQGEVLDLLRAGFVDVRWWLPEETGYFQPIVTARQPGERTSERYRAS